MVVDRPETLDLLRRDAQQIERAMQDAGLKTGENGMQFSLRDQNAGQQHNEPRGNTARIVAPAEDLPLVDTVAQNSYGRWTASRGGVDIRI
jgi:flagellar hook-length control protein FliK